MGEPPGVELAGYLSASVGVGEAARGYVTALRSIGVNVAERDVPLPGRDSAGARPAPAQRPPQEQIRFNLLCMNPEQMVPYLEGPDAPPLAGRTTIGIWSWEVDVLPSGWREASARVAEVWTYSEFAARLIGRGIGAEVLGMPPPVLTQATPEAPATLGVELPDRYRFLVVFDFLSTLERKNPIAAIEAFRMAFAPDDGAALILKSINGRHRREAREELLAAALGRPDVISLDRTMSGAERDALLARCDCFVSLHRSEGHGLPIAEAMALGKPVVATAYGGNMEFMSETNSYPVAWAPVGVGAGVEHYPAQATWAEPDVAQAARLLQQVRADPAAAGARGERASRDVRAQLSPEVLGTRMLRRLRELEPRPRRGRARQIARRLVGRPC